MGTKSIDYTWEIVNAKTKIDVDAGTSYSGGDYAVNGFMKTSIGGVAIKMVNKTGSASVKGMLIETSESIANSFQELTDEYDCVGIVYEAGVADGSECYVVIQGIAEVLLEDGTASTLGNWVESSTVNGRADATNPLPAGGTIAELQNHFKEIGHCLETKTAGTDVLAKIIVHFN